MPEVNLPMMVVRKYLSATEGTPADTRINPVTGEVETTPDGGVSWNPNPGADPRVSPAYTKTPVGDACAAAAGMIEGMQGFAVGTFAITTVAGGATILLGITLFLLPVSWMWLMFLSVAGAFLAAGGAAIWADFTEDVWHDLLCILACNLDADGLLTADTLEIVKGQIAELGIPSVVTGTNLIFEAWGFVGLNNAGIVYADPEADCGDCLCTWCKFFDAAEDGDMLDFWTLSHGVQTENAVYATIVSGSTYGLSLLITLVEDVTSMRVDFEFQFGNAQPSIYLVNQGTSTVIWGYGYLQPNPIIPGGVINFGTTIPAGTSLRLQLNSNNAAGLVTGVIFRGENDNPYGENDCV